MTFGEKLSRLRKESNYTQEQLADILSVSRQSISKWESNMAYPETEKLIRMSKLFDCSLDYLLNEDCSEKHANNNNNTNSDSFSSIKKQFHERKSEKTWHGMPLWHVAKNARGVVAVGLKARGIIAIGLKAEGVVSLGLLSIGILAFGFLSIGLLAFGTFALGLLSAGGIAAGIFSTGGISLGIISIGGLACGDFSIGGLAIGKYIAIGGDARAQIALGNQKAAGSIYQYRGDLNLYDPGKVKNLLDSNVPKYLEFFKNIFKSFI